MRPKGIYKAASEGQDSLPFIKGRTAPQVPPEAEARDPEEGIDYGVIVLPPVMDEHNPEMEGYPEEYLEACKDRLRDYKEANGELPKWERSEWEDDTAPEVNT